MLKKSKLLEYAFLMMLRIYNLFIIVNKKTFYQEVIYDIHINNVLG